MKMKADIEMKKLESDKRVMELIRLGKTQGGFVALSQIEEKFPEAMRTEKGLDHVTELLGRSLISILRSGCVQEVLSHDLIPSLYAWLPEIFPQSEKVPQNLPVSFPDESIPLLFCQILTFSFQCLPSFSCLPSFCPQAFLFYSL